MSPTALRRMRANRVRGGRLHVADHLPCTESSGELVTSRTSLVAQGELLTARPELELRLNRDTPESLNQRSDKFLGVS